MTLGATPPRSACAPQRNAVSHPPFSKTTPDIAYLRKVISLVSFPRPRQRQVWGAWQIVLTHWRLRRQLWQQSLCFCHVAGSWEWRLEGNVYL